MKVHRIKSGRKLTEEKVWQSHLKWNNIHKMQMYPLAGKYGLYSQAKENSKNLNKEEDNWLFFGAPT